MIATENTLQQPASVLTRKQRERLTVAILIVIDIMALGIAYLGAYLLRFVLLPYTAEFEFRVYSFLMIGMIPVWLIIFAIYQLYDQHVLFGGLLPPTGLRVAQARADAGAGHNYRRQ